MPKFQLYFRNDDDNFLSKQKLQVSWKMHLTLIDTYKQISWRRGKIAFEVTYFNEKLFYFQELKLVNKLLQIQQTIMWMTEITIKKSQPH